MPIAPYSAHLSLNLSQQINVCYFPFTQAAKTISPRLLTLIENIYSYTLHIFIYVSIS